TYMRSIYEAMSTRLKADPQFHSGPVAKTPGHPWWQTWEIHNHVYELGELADHVDLVNKLPWSKGPKLESAAHSRHCILFEELRFYAYSVVNREREQGSFETFMRVLEAYAFNHNSFAKHGFTQDLAMSSVRATVKSVARWTWERYTGSGRCHRGAMQLDKKLPLIERQRLSAQRSSQLRQKATESKIRAACRQLLAQGKSLAQVAIARAAGITRQTVALYKHLIDESMLPASVSPIEGSGQRRSVVKFGAHQVSAAPKGNEIQTGFGRLDPVSMPGLPEPSS
ncbi:MAG: replication protein A, partial [Cytophagaceae bacterium]